MHSIEYSINQYSFFFSAALSTERDWAGPEAMQVWGEHLKKRGDGAALWIYILSHFKANHICDFCLADDKTGKKKKRLFLSGKWQNITINNSNNEAVTLLSNHIFYLTIVRQTIKQVWSLLKRNSFKYWFLQLQNTLFTFINVHYTRVDRYRFP